MAVCKTFRALLPPIVTVIKCNAAVITQTWLQRLTKTFANLTELRLKQKYDESSEKLDFSTVYLPELRRLSLCGCPLRSIEFNQTSTPKLQYLHMEQTGAHSAAGFELDLPNLQYLSFMYVDVSF